MQIQPLATPLLHIPASSTYLDPSAATAALSSDVNALDGSVSSSSSQPIDPRTQQAMVDFESVFVSALIKQMRQSIGGEGLFPGDHSDTLGGLFDLFMGQHLAKAGGLGMSHALQQSYAKSNP